ARGDREPRPALPAHRHPLLGAVPGDDRDPGGAPARPLRHARAEEGLVRAAAWAVGGAAALAWPLMAPRYFVFLATLVAVNAVVAIGLTLLPAYTTQLSFGHAGFLAVGAYPAAILPLRVPALP